MQVLHVRSAGPGRPAAAAGRLCRGEERQGSRQGVSSTTIPCQRSQRPLSALAKLSVQGQEGMAALTGARSQAVLSVACRGPAAALPLCNFLDADMRRPGSLPLCAVPRPARPSSRRPRSRWRLRARASRPSPRADTSSRRRPQLPTCVRSPTTGSARTSERDEAIKGALGAGPRRGLCAVGQGSLRARFAWRGGRRQGAAVRGVRAVLLPE